MSSIVKVSWSPILRGTRKDYVTGDR
jgi:hypothetical protein